ncbi:GntR family transcriptional regulator, partial [Streptomyces sp. WAC 05379]
RGAARAPPGPWVRVTGRLAGRVRLPFTVGGAVAEEAAVRLAAAARLVESGASGVSGAAESARPFVA